MKANIQHELDTTTCEENTPELTLPVLVIAIDPFGMIKRVNDEASNLTGWDTLELTNLPIQSLIIETQRNRFIKLLDESIRSNRNCTITVNILDKQAGSAAYYCNLVSIHSQVDNEIILYALPLEQPNNDALKPIHKNTEDESYVSMLTTIELLSKVASISITGVTICDSEKKVLWVNTAFEKITGYCLDEIKNRHLGPILQGKNTDKNVIKTIRTAINNGRDVDVEIVNYAKSGDEYWCHLLISPVFENESVTHFIGIQHDITHQKRQHEIISNHSRVHAVAELAGKVCHDINNIMAIISGNVQLLSMHKSDDKIAKYINNIEIATKRASSVTQDLLQIVKSKKQDKQLVNINHVINEVVTLINNRLETSMSFVTDLQCNDEIAINKNFFFEAMLSLLSSAVLAIEDAGHLSIETRSVDTFTPGSGIILHYPKTHSRYAFIRATDSGIGRGIEPARIKNDFSLIDDFCTRSNSGLELVRTNGKVTTFCIWIPMDRLGD